MADQAADIVALKDVLSKSGEAGTRERSGGYLQEQHGRSQRRSAALVGSVASVLRYRSKRADDVPITERLCHLATERPRFGYRRLHVLLRREELVFNIKKTHRLYRQAKLHLRRRSAGTSPVACV